MSRHEGQHERMHVRSIDWPHDGPSSSCRCRRSHEGSSYGVTKSRGTRAPAVGQPTHDTSGLRVRQMSDHCTPRDGIISDHTSGCHNVKALRDDMRRKPPFLGLFGDLFYLFRKRTRASCSITDSIKLGCARGSCFHHDLIIRVKEVSSFIGTS